MIDPTTLSVRTLNYWRKQHIPTYLGLRYFLEDSKNQSLDAWLLDFIKKKLKTRSKERIYKYQRFKSKKKGERNYRNFKALSPTSALIETYILFKLSQTSEFEPRNSVYSRKWPASEKSGHIFEYYLEGYKQRITDINNALKNEGQQKLFICDIKDFYNSVDPSTALSKFSKLLNESNLEDDLSRLIIEFTERIIDPAEMGIPIGPAISHVLSKMVLYDFDDELENEYPSSYFRYVDDMAIVVGGDLKQAKQFVKKQLGKLDLKLNSSKTETLSKSEWLSNQNDFKMEKGPETFYGLLNRIRAYSYTKPDCRHEITNLFSKEGYTFPLTRIFSKQSNKIWYFNYVMNSYIRKRITDGTLTSEHLTLRTIWNDSPQKILETAKKLESDFKNQVLELIEKDLPARGMQRKFKIQEIKHYLYKLFYFFEPSEYDQFLNVFIPDEKEFAQIRLVASSLLNRRVDELVYIPGIPILIFSSIWTDQEMGTLELNWEGLDLSQKPIRDSLAILTLYDVINPPEQFYERLEHDEGVYDLNSVILGDERKFNDLSYLDEFSSLGLDKTTDERIEFLKTRFDDRERFGMDALALDFGTSPSPA